MATAAPESVLEKLLTPIAGAATPAGDRLADEDLAEIEKARHSDDGGTGVWAADPVEPNWHRVRDLTAAALTSRCKHLNLAVWYAEAEARIHGLPGVNEGLRLIGGLIERFWNQGLLPAIEDGDVGFRARPLGGLNAKVAPVLRQIPLTGRSDGGENYSLIRFLQARKAGREKDLRDAHGNLDSKKQADRREVLEAGGISGEQWEIAEAATRRAFYEQLSSELEETSASIVTLVRLMDRPEFFGPVEAPSVRELRDVIESMQRVVGPILKRKREEEPDAPSVKQEAAPAGNQPNSPAQSMAQFTPSEPGDSAWEHARELARAGRVEEALAEMTRIGTQGHERSRFLHKLDLAELCVASGRNGRAMVILENLDEQIKTLNLAQWESPELIARVWGQLYRQYKKSADHQTQAPELYLRLCRLDPWQGLKWSAE